MVWSAEAAQATQDGLGHAEHLLPAAGDGQRDGRQAVVDLLDLAGDLDLDAALGGHDDRVGELAAEADHLGVRGTRSATARAASAIVYMPCAITPGSPTLRGDRLVLVDRVVVAAGLGVRGPGRRG